MRHRYFGAVEFNVFINGEQVFVVVFVAVVCARADAPLAGAFILVHQVNVDVVRLGVDSQQRRVVGQHVSFFALFVHGGEAQAVVVPLGVEHFRGVFCANAHVAVIVPQNDVLPAVQAEQRAVKGEVRYVVLGEYGGHARHEAADAVLFLQVGGGGGNR